MSFSIAANFNSASPGPMTNAVKKQVWSDPAIQSLTDGDGVGARFAIMAGGGRYGGNCQRMYYPAGQFGEYSEWYQLNFGSPGVPISVEFDWMFEAGFDLYEGGGKCAPWIFWGSASPYGVVQGVWWDSQGTPAQHLNPYFEFIMQCQRAGFQPHEMVVGVYSPGVIQPGQWYHFRWRMMGGPNAFAQYFMDGNLVTSLSAANLSQVTAVTDPVAVNFGTFVGGGDASFDLKTDCWSRMDNVVIQTG